MNACTEGQPIQKSTEVSLVEVAPKDNSFGATVPMAKILGGSYSPLYGKLDQLIQVPSFYMDVYPVSNRQFLQFVKQYSNWQKSQVKKIFADDNYLLHWSSDTIPGKNISDNSPVTAISWYAAKSYCECVGKRLPTVDEWEFVAMSNQTETDARKDKSYNQYILDWYEKPKTYKNSIGQTFKNVYGVYDLHGLVWEWTADFNSILLSGESRNDVTTDNNLFCGSGSLNASDLMNYAAFMRYAFRGSLKANYSVQNLGFRCVVDSLQ
jgi:formylglycine-generating enzyme required for sulfatase activity